MEIKRDPSEEIIEAEKQAAIAAKKANIAALALKYKERRRLKPGNPMERFAPSHGPIDCHGPLDDSVASEISSPPDPRLAATIRDRLSKIGVPINLDRRKITYLDNSTRPTEL